MASKSNAQDKARQFFRDIRKQRLASVYLFQGDERYLISKAIEEVLRKVFGDHEPDPFQLDMFRGNDADAKQILGAVRTIPMMGGTRLVIVQEIEHLADAEVALIAEYARAPVSGTCLVLAGKLDGRKGPGRSLKKTATFVDFVALRDNQMASWIQRQSRRYQMTIPQNVADYIADAIGADMTMTDVALEKLSLVTLNSATITLEQAKEVVGQTREHSVFELTNALSSRDLPASLAALGELFAQSEPPVKIGYMIARHLRILLNLKAAQSGRVDQSEYASIAGVRPYQLKGYLQDTKKFSLRELVSLQRGAFELDRALKSSRLSAEHLIERLVFSICSRDAR